MKGKAFTAPNAKILIVDDNGVNLKIAAGLLKPLNMKIETAENGQAALEMIKINQYHIIFMDYLMPGMNGIETVTQLRLMDGDYYKKVPVIALTAEDVTAEGASATEKFFRAGMNDYLAKPMDANGIRIKVRSWLPDDLIVDAADETENFPAVDEPENDLPVINGIDSALGIRFSGSKERFIRLIGDFYKLIDLKAARIEKFLADGFIRELVTEVHALKATAKMIGAAELSEGFFRLERYGREGQPELLARDIHAVLDLYKSYKALLKPIAEGEAEGEKKVISREEMLLLLNKLSSAMSVFDLDQADEIMKTLEQSQIPHKYKATMAYLSAYVADAAVECVTALAGKLIKIIENTKDF